LAQVPRGHRRGRCLHAHRLTRSPGPSLQVDSPQPDMAHHPEASSLSAAGAWPSQRAGLRRLPQAGGQPGGRAIAPHLRKTKLCSYYLAGHCRLGVACAFAHDEEELRAAPDLWKTRLCHTYMATGQCNDRACGFAHGQAELRATGQFYKRMLCKFHQRGKCRNDDQCRFAHGSDDLRNSGAGLAAAPEPTSEPMKVQLPSRRPDLDMPPPMLFAEQPVARPGAQRVVEQAAGTANARQLAEQVRCLQRQLLDLTSQYDMALRPAASSLPPGLAMEEMELAASVWRSGLFTGTAQDAVSQWTMLCAA